MKKNVFNTHRLENYSRHVAELKNEFLDFFKENEEKNEIIYLNNKKFRETFKFVNLYRGVNLILK